jgi:hypothetical protein
MVSLTRRWGRVPTHGECMRLSDDDGRAVDLVLETRSGQRGSGGNGQDNGASLSFHNTLPSQSVERLERVVGLLDLLRDMPVAEPPEDLVARTLARIEQYDARPTPVLSDRPVPPPPGTRVQA